MRGLEGRGRVAVRVDQAEQRQKILTYCERVLLRGGPRPGFGRRQLVGGALGDGLADLCAEGAPDFTGGLLLGLIGNRPGHRICLVLRKDEIGVVPYFP